ncbi:sensor of ECF-type sigma factor [Tamlana crocina]|uniref:Sensor of ECF-type sigma factor n=1 Tax=Tamlana crocina TaxID=393006 RepID=A0ABX1DIV4_9FLAO|nr:sensor of ECF-type sigma factor [Tamlana crocina]NJX16246.1 sensor of ECF-type sigma factor [Tamlana crocina]
MKHIITIIALIFTVNSFSQSKRERIDALKVTYITEKLDLTEKEAQQFWPIYNAYDDVTDKIKYGELKKIRREVKENATTISNERANELLDKIAIALEKLHEEEVKLNNKLKKIIPPKKIILLKIAEEDFKKRMFEEWKKRREQKRNK